MNKAAVFILLGQSNAVGHDLPMREEDKITVPLKYVFKADRAENQSLCSDSLIWSGYTSRGVNLAEEQDDTYSLANCLAAIWEKNAEPQNLPELYIIQIAIGAQGVTEGFMWNPDYPEKLIPGRLGTVDISLYSYTCRVLSRLNSFFKRQNREYEVIGLHWRGGEQDMMAKRSVLTSTLKSTYCTLFDGFCKSLGKRPNIFLHRLYCFELANMFDPTGGYLKNTEYINNVFDELAEENENIKIFSFSDYPKFCEKQKSYGLFNEDMVHYTAEANLWAAEKILNDFTGSKNERE